MQYDAPRRRSVELGNGKFGTVAWTRQELAEYRRNVLGMGGTRKLDAHTHDVADLRDNAIELVDL